MASVADRALIRDLRAALRKLADPEKAPHKDSLSPLSKREAVRNLIKAGLIDAVP